MLIPAFTPRTRLSRWLACCLLIASVQAEIRSPQEILGASAASVLDLLNPAGDAEPRTVTGALRIVQADGIAPELAGRTAEWALQAPDRFRLSAQIDGHPFVMGRRGNELWVLAPDRRFGVIGSPDVPRFLGRPETVEPTELPPLRLPVDRRQMLLLPLLFAVEALPGEVVADQSCSVLRLRPQPLAIQTLGLPSGVITLWIRDQDSLPVRLAATDADGRRLIVELENLRVDYAHPDANWDLPPDADGQVERVALAHLVRFFPAALSILRLEMPALGGAVSSRSVLAESGEGRLEDRDGTRVLFLKGTPEAMGRQQGELLRASVRDLVSKVLYGVGVGSSFEKGRWFLGEIEECQARLEPFIEDRYLREMDALASAVELHPQEIRLANFFPELFHCSGFALWGQATVDGRLYHGRVLDYMKGIGLEPNAVVMVHQPETGYAWANISYAGFVGSVSAMNEKRLSLGEMGGRGEGQWDGKPMAQLVREVMEQAATLEEGLAIMRRGPRTCEYFYVLADGNTRRAVGIAATPESFEVIGAGMAHPRLPHAVPDAVLLSAGDRYELLVARAIQGYGRFDAPAARALMERPVAMTSNIHSVLFAPESLDFWVANADSRNLAAHARYTHYNLAELLDRPESPSLATSTERAESPAGSPFAAVPLESPATP